MTDLNSGPLTLEKLPKENSANMKFRTKLENHMEWQRPKLLLQPCGKCVHLNSCLFVSAIDLTQKMDPPITIILLMPKPKPFENQNSCLESCRTSTWINIIWETLACSEHLTLKMVQPFRLQCTTLTMRQKRWWQRKPGSVHTFTNINSLAMMAT